MVRCRRETRFVSARGGWGGIASLNNDQLPVRPMTGFATPCLERALIGALTPMPFGKRPCLPGASGSPPKIPGDSVLVFKIEIIKINGDKVEASRCDPETKEGCSEKEAKFIDVVAKKFKVR